MGDNAGQCSFSQTGRAAEQYVIHGFAAEFRGLNGNGQLFTHMRLAGKIVEPRRPQGRFKLPVIILGRWRNHAVGAH